MSGQRSAALRQDAAGVDAPVARSHRWPAAMQSVDRSLPVSIGGLTHTSAWQKVRHPPARW
ncbi:hypothetical protein, partial [Xanthomonas fragariae]|uniref:hypothetical protein n=1 Tax=Xanthomonas fragariae TaxID=48664 RepID=UPI001F3EE3A5